MWAHVWYGTTPAGCPPHHHSTCTTSHRPVPAIVRSHLSTCECAHDACAVRCVRACMRACVHVGVSVCECVCTWVRACMCACIQVRAQTLSCVRACVRACVHGTFSPYIDLGGCVLPYTVSPSATHAAVARVSSRPYLCKKFSRRCYHILFIDTVIL